MHSDNAASPAMKPVVAKLESQCCLQRGNGANRLHLLAGSAINRRYRRSMGDENSIRRQVIEIWFRIQSETDKDVSIFVQDDKSVAVHDNSNRGA